MSDANKVVVNLSAVGSAPQLKQTKFKIGGEQTFASIVSFLRKQLRLRPEDSVFAYCMSAFSPAPDTTVADLNAAFGAQNVLTIHYCLTPAYG
jgi:ubiquitin-like protein ATG12